MSVVMQSVLSTANSTKTVSCIRIITAESYCTTMTLNVFKNFTATVISSHESLTTSVNGCYENGISG